MENHYLCPHCRGHLRVGEYIIFKIRNKRREKGLLLLHPEIGEYTSIKHPQLNFKEGERIDFFCPICLQSLDATMDENLVHVIMTDARQKEHKVFFSRITGERSTYKKSEQNVMETDEYSHQFTRFTMSDDYIQYLPS